MKISNETKIGALTAISITFLILGFNFLKGKSLFKTGNFLYARYSDTKKLMPSNPVFVNGFQVGRVSEIEAGTNDLSSVVVSINLDQAYEIPVDSYAEIESNPLGSSSMVIYRGTSTNFLKSDDTLATKDNEGALGAITSKFLPVADQLKITLASLDSVLKNVNTVLDPNAKNNLQSTIGNLNKVSASVMLSAASLQAMLNQQTGALASSLNNMSSFTKNLSDNNDKITSTMNNLDKATENLANADIDGAVNNLKESVEKLNAVMTKINSTDGTLGAIINEKEMYNNINNTLLSLNTLMDDLRVHPKRYVNVSVFGKKDKGDYLTEPLKDSTNTASPEKK